MLGDVLGDIICVEGDCKQGEAQIATMKAFFASLGQPAEFRSAVASLLSAYDSAEASWTRHIPFASVCCEIKGLGTQAESLTKRMAASRNIIGPGELKAPKGAIEGALETTQTLTVVAVLLALGVGAYYVLGRRA